MATPNPTRLSPAELRRRLLAAPTDALPPVTDEAPAPRRRPEGRSSSSMATQAAIDLEVLSPEVIPTGPRTAPMPEVRYDSTPFRLPEAGYSPPSYHPAAPHAAPAQHAAPAAPAGPAPSQGEIDYLRAHNQELSRIIEEMRPLLEEASTQETRYQEREHEYQGQLAERDAQLEELKTKVALLEEHIANIPPPKVPKTRDELEEWSDELEKEASKITQERRRLDDDRRQLRDDEEALERQMREMEVSMARERAMMARQETELKRLSAEIQHEIEILQRGDGNLREQLAKFQRRHQEVLGRGSGGPPPAPVGMSDPAPPAAPTQPSKKDSGLLRRIFRGSK